MITMTNPPPPPEKESSQQPTAPAPSASAEIISPGLDTVLRKAGIDTRDPKVTKAIEITQTQMILSGSLPLPPPIVLEEYNAAFPGLVEQIVVWTEEQRRHRMKLERERT